MHMRKLFLFLGGVVFFAAQAIAQRSVTGKVKDEKGNTLPNVSVLARGTTTGTVTKADGTYTLTVPANAKALVFSSVDMSPVEKAIGSATVIDATLKAEDKTISEVIVTAFGIKKDKKTLGYDVWKVSAENSIQYPTSYQIETVNRFPDYQNSYAQGNIDFRPTIVVSGVTVPNPDFMKGVFSGSSTSSWGPLITGQIVKQYNPATNAIDRSAPLAAYPDNVRDIFQNGYNWQNNISFSGGTDKNTFRFSYGYLKNTGVRGNNVLNRHNFSLNTSSKVTNYLTISASGNYSNNASRRTQQGNQLSNPLFRGWFTPRSFDLTGLPFENVTGDQLYPLGEDNPYWTIKNNRYRDEINRFIGNVAFHLN